MSGMLIFWLPFNICEGYRLTTFREQAVQDTIDRLRSSQIKEDYTKSVRINSTSKDLHPVTFSWATLLKPGPTPFENTLLMESWKDRVCIQGHHSCEHHVSWCKREGLRRCTVSEESSRKAALLAHLKAYVNTTPGQAYRSFFRIPHLPIVTISWLRHDRFDCRCESFCTESHWRGC
jgi:hypothetical protein